MEPILKVRCTKGNFVIYQDKVAIELKGWGVNNVNSLPFSQITGVELKTTYASLFGKGGMAKLTVFSVGNQKIEASIAPLSDAKKVEELIRNKLGKNNKNDSNIDDLEKLSQLKENGVITKEEFEKKKKQILGI